MKITEYFNQQKALHLSDQEKLELYQRILIRQKSKGLVRTKYFFITKRFAYNFLLTLIFVGIFGYILSQKNIIDYGSFLVKFHSPNEVEAGYIGQVLDFEGDFYIDHKGEIFKGKNIANGDTIILKNNTKLVFDIENGSKAIIKGPAELVLEKFKRDNKYRITLLQGDFIQMESTDQRNVQKIELSVKGENILVKQGGNNQPINFQLVKQGNQHIVKNNGGEILVTKIGEDNETKDQILNNEQVLSIKENDIEVYENLDQFAIAIKEKNISQLFAFDINKSTEKETTIMSQNENQQTEQLDEIEPQDDINIILSTEENEPENIEISKDIKPILSIDQETDGTKRVPTEIQMQKLRSALVGNFLLSNIEDIYLYQSIGDQEKLDNALYRLQSKTKQLYQIFDIGYNGSQSMSSIKNYLNKLYTELPNKYFIPPTYLQNIKTLANRLEKIEVVPFGGETDLETTKNYRDSLKSNPDLIFHQDN